MSIDNVASTNTSYKNSNFYFDASMATMSPEDVMNYVRKALTNIGLQLNDYKDMVTTRLKKQEQLQEALSIMRRMKTADGTIQGHFDGNEYNRMMTLLAENPDIAPSMSAYKTFMDSYGGFQADHDFVDANGQLVRKGDVVGTMAGADQVGVDPYIEIDSANSETKEMVPNPNYNTDQWDCKLNKEETTEALSNARDGLENLNKDNETTMLGLKQLMDRRNEISQFVSNFLSNDHELKKALIANMR